MSAHEEPSRRFRAVSCILTNRDRILLLKRSDRVLTNPGLWSTVAGRVDPGSNDDTTALEEIQEETGLTPAQVTFVRKGAPVEVRPTGGAITTVYPLLFRTRSRRIRLNWEHTEYAWVTLQDVGRFAVVPKFLELLKNLALLPEGGAERR